jgi:hypothetical protein
VVSYLQCFLPHKLDRFGRAAETRRMMRRGGLKCDIRPCVPTAPPSALSALRHLTYRSGAHSLATDVAPCVYRCFSVARAFVALHRHAKHVKQAYKHAMGGRTPLGSCGKLCSHPLSGQGRGWLPHLWSSTRWCIHSLKSVNIVFDSTP